MNTDSSRPDSHPEATHSPQDDLAFIRALFQPEDSWQQQFGKIYTACGLCYCVQMALHAGQLLGLVSGEEWVGQMIGWGPTVVFAGLLIAFIRREGPRRASGVTSRAVGSVFAAVGISNIALAVCIGSVALRLHSQTIWFIYPCVVMVLQGLAWLVAYMLRRRSWLGLVALGWFATGAAMAFFIDNMVGFVASASAGLFLFMLLPGLYLMRQTRDA